MFSVARSIVELFTYVLLMKITMKTTGQFIPKKKTRYRGENWESSEKQAFLKLIRPSAQILEIKLTDTDNNKLKQREWMKIQHQLKLITGRHREIGQLKNFWGRIKGLAKKSVAEYRKALEDGLSPPSPPPGDYEILEMCGNDLPTDQTACDCGVDTQHTGHNHEVFVETNGENNSPVFVKHENPLQDSNAEEHVSVDDDDDSNESVNLALSTKNCESRETESIKLSYIPKKKQTRQPKRKTTRMEFRNRTSITLMEREHQLKIEYQEREAEHQQLRHKLEIDILKLEKERKLLELGNVKKNLLLMTDD